MTAQLMAKINEILSRYRGLIVAYSGGMDSGLLALLARKFFEDRMKAILVSSELMPSWESERAIQLARSHDIPLEVVKVPLIEEQAIFENGPERCYFCKKKIISILKDRTPEGWTIAEGSQKDDLQDTRPGRKALIEENIRSPLLEAGLDKNDISRLLTELGAPEFISPPRPCLATRFRTGVKLTPENLKRVAEAERILFEFSFRCYRVRDHGSLASIEFGQDEIEKAFAMRNDIAKELLKTGYERVAMDLAGYRSAAMNMEVFSRKD